MSKQNSVDFLWDELKGFISDGQYAGVMEIYLKSKAMHKEEQISFAKKCLDKALDLDVRTAHSKVEEMYNETFGGNNE